VSVYYKRKSKVKKGFVLKVFFIFFFTFYFWQESREEDDEEEEKVSVRSCSCV